MAVVATCPAESVVARAPSTDTVAPDTACPLSKTVISRDDRRVSLEPVRAVTVPSTCPSKISTSQPGWMRRDPRMLMLTELRVVWQTQVTFASMVSPNALCDCVRRESMPRLRELALRVAPEPVKLPEPSTLTTPSDGS